MVGEVAELVPTQVWGPEGWDSILRQEMGTGGGHASPVLL